MSEFAGIKEFNPLVGIHPSLEADNIPSPDIDLPFDCANDSFGGPFEIDLTVPQMQFYELDCQYPLFVAGMGSGKSQTLALRAVTDVINFPGANVAIYAPTYDLMSLILVPYVSALLEEGGYSYSYNGQSHTFAIQGHGNMICRSLDTPRRIVGYETFRAHCDELDTLPLEKAEEAWNKIIARNRQKVYMRDENGNRIPERDENGAVIRDNGNVVWKMHQNRVCAYTTPEGWNFAYKRWVEKKTEGYEMVTASTYSNAHNLPPDYIPNLLKSYPPELAEAYVEGKFTNLTSGRVYRFFDRELNNSKHRVRSTDVLHIGMDFNIEHGSAVIFVERKCPETGEIHDHAVDEIADSYDTDDTIRAILERYPNNKAYIYPDATGKKRYSGGGAVDSKGEATHTDLWKLRQVKHWTVVVDRSNPAIKDRVNCLSARICDGEKKRRLFVNTKKCPALTKTLEQQVWNNGVPDKSQGLDHAGDSAGYAMWKKYPTIKSKEGFVKVHRGGSFRRRR